MAGQESGLKLTYGNATNFMNIVINRMKENDRKKIDLLTYTATHIVKRLNDNGQLLITKDGKPDEVTEIIAIYKNNGKLEKRVIRRNNQATNDSKPRGFSLEMSQILATRYNFSFAHNQPMTVGNREYIILNFKPKNGLTVTLKEDHILNRANGKIFVDANSFLIWKLEAWIPDEFSVATWLKVFSGNLMFEQQEIDGIAVERIVTITARYRNGWGMFADPTNLDEVYTYYDHKRVR